MDSGAGKGLNIISEEALDKIKYEDRKLSSGVEVRGLFNAVYIKETVKLRFRFWDRLDKEESFEEEFLVLPKIAFLGLEGPDFDCLLCWNWMKTHQSAWIPMLKQA